MKSKKMKRQEAYLRLLARFKSYMKHRYFDDANTIYKEMDHISTLDSELRVIHMSPEVLGLWKDLKDILDTRKNTR